MSLLRSGIRLEAIDGYDGRAVIDTAGYAKRGQLNGSSAVNNADANLISVAFVDLLFNGFGR